MLTVKCQLSKSKGHWPMWWSVLLDRNKHVTNYIISRKTWLLIHHVCQLSSKNSLYCSVMYISRLSSKYTKTQRWHQCLPLTQLYFSINLSSKTFFKTGVNSTHVLGRFLHRRKKHSSHPCVYIFKYGPMLESGWRRSQSVQSLPLKIKSKVCHKQKWLLCASCLCVCLHSTNTSNTSPGVLFLKYNYNAPNAEVQRIRSVR
jgi:hypothetical protein